MAQPQQYRTSKYSGIGSDSNEYYYTKGKEFTTENGEEYVGEYHLLPQGQAFTGPTRNTTGKGANTPRRLFPYYSNYDSFVYDQIFLFDTKVKQFVQPIPYLYSPREEEGVYVDGFDMRYFVQRRNADTYAIEINEEQFNRIGKAGGIDDSIYAYVAVIWKLTGTFPSIEAENKRIINVASQELPALPYAIPSYTQFARETLQSVFNNEDSYYVKPKYRSNKPPIRQTYDRATGRIIP